MPALLTVEDAAAELGTPVRFVRRLIHERRIRFHKIGKYVRIARGDLEAFVAAGRVDPTCLQRRSASAAVHPRWVWPGLGRKLQICN